MRTESNDNIPAIIDAYLYGLLDESEHRRVEHRIASDPAWREAIGAE